MLEPVACSLQLKAFRLNRKAARYKLQAARHKLQAAGHKLLTSGYTSGWLQAIKALSPINGSGFTP